MTRFRSILLQRTTPSFRPVRPRLDDLGESGQLLGRKPRRRALRTNVHQPIRAFGVEAVNPVTQRLPIHSANPRRIFAVHAVQNRSQRQKTATSIGVLRTGGKSPKLHGRIVRPDLHRCGHGANPPRARESVQPDLGNLKGYVRSAARSWTRFGSGPHISRIERSRGSLASMGKASEGADWRADVRVVNVGGFAAGVVLG